MHSRIYILFLAIFFTSALHAQNSILIEISGQVKGKEKKEPISDVSVQVKGNLAGTTTDNQGNFKLRTKTRLPFTLVFTSIGYSPREVEIKSLGDHVNVELATQTVLGNEVVVTASRVPESILKSPVAIEKLDIRSIKQSPSANYYDALENVKGVQMTTSSITFKVPNTRGFNIPNNFRFMQLVDGVDVQAPTLGVPLGITLGPSQLDIQSVEITPGAASALYGVNAMNGLANLITKNAFTSQGLSVYQQVGVNHVDGIDHAPAVLTETAIRFAKAISNRFAVKFDFGYMQGTDWVSNTRTDQNPNNLPSANPLYPALNDPNNAAYDGWNKYGDDALAGSNVVSISGLTIDGAGKQTLRVARTGYWEKDLVTPQVSNLKFYGELDYRLSEKLQLSYGYRYGKMDGEFQRGNKIRLDGMSLQNHHLTLQGQNFSIIGYVTIENTGNSYNLKPLADNMDLYSGGATDTKTATSWGTKFKNALNTYASQNGGGLTSDNLAAATQYARQQADAGRVEPGTAAFDQLKNTIININNWDIKSSAIPNAPVTGGAALWQRSNTYSLNGQWDLSKKVKFFDLLLGADGIIYQVIPDGNNFVDFSRPISERNQPVTVNGKVPDSSDFGKNQIYEKFGGFAQVTKTFLDEKLKVFASLRADHNPYFNPVFTPRLAAVYTVNQVHNFRFTFQQGYRFPAIFEALSFVNNGRVRRVGSLPFINEGLGYLENSYTQQSVVNFNAVVSAKGNSDSTALANANLLQVANLPAAKPEQITTFEIGYRSVLLDNRLVLDFDAYYNTYFGFLGQVQVYVPKGQTVGSNAAVLAMLDRNRDSTAATATTAASYGQDRYRVYTNAKNTYHSFGSSLSVTYNLYKRYIVGGVINYNDIQSTASNDIFITGFNTPRLSSNISFGNSEVIKHVGFNIVWRWQDSFLWQSQLVNGTVPAFSSLDAQVSFTLPKVHSTIKIGGTNVLDNRYLQYAGGPTIGAMYYASITVDGLLTGK